MLKCHFKTKTDGYFFLSSLSTIKWFHVFLMSHFRFRKCLENLYRRIVLPWFAPVYVFVIIFLSPLLIFIDCKLFGGMGKWVVSLPFIYWYHRTRYEAVHEAMMELISKVEKDNYHGWKLRHLLKGIATMGS